MNSLHWRLRIRNGEDSADDIVVTSLPNGPNPYIAEDGIPRGEGQSLSPVTGEVTTGSFTIGVIDAVDQIAVEELVASDGFEYANQGAMEANGWTVQNTTGAGAWSIGATDLAYAGTRSLKGTINGLGGGGALTAVKVFGPSDGVQPLTSYTVKLRGRMNNRPGFDVGAKLLVSGATIETESAITTEDTWQELIVKATSTIDAELTVQVHRNGGYPYVQFHETWFDDLRIYTHLTGENRIITSRLADGQGKQHLLSRRAYIEEALLEDLIFDPETEEYEWPEGAGDVLVAGYLNALELTTALRFTATVGESRRIEQTVKVFEVPEPGFDRVSCIIGGPVIGDFGPLVDGGRPIFEVSTVTDNRVEMRWKSGYLYRPMSERHPPLENHNGDFLNALARQYLGDPQSIPLAEFLGSAIPFRDLRVRLFALDTDVGVTENYPAGISQDFLPLVVAGNGFTLSVLSGDVEPGIISRDGDKIVVAWPDDPSYPAQPSVGTRFKVAIFPLTISESNPLHWEGHPVDFVTGLKTIRGQAYNAASAATVKAEMGDLRVRYRITQSMTHAKAEEELAYGPFGFTARNNSDGEFEFFTTRRRKSSLPVDTLTLDDLRDPTPPIWKIEEGSAVNKVTYRFRAFNLQPNQVVRSQTQIPIDFILEADDRYEAVPDPSDYEVYGDRSITYDVPGRLVDADIPQFVAGQTAEIFEERGRGAIISQLAVLRGRTDALIGEEVVLDFAHLPTANPTQSPVSQRGTTPRIAVVLRRTPTPGGPDLVVQDRGIALQAPLVPEFTVTQSVVDGRKIATVEITNGEDIENEDAKVRVEWAISSGSPSSSRLLRIVDPATDALVFDTPAVDAGSRVWVRMRTEQPGKRPGAWSDFEDVQLDALDAPTDFAGTVTGAYADLSWVLGANAADMPLEVLLREDGETVWEPFTVLPSGSTGYRLYFPDPDQAYDVGLRHRESAPFGGVSSTVTLALTSAPIEQLTAPINPAAWSDGRGTFGIEVTATVFPSGTAVAVAVETAVGSGIAGSYEAAGSVVSVQNGRTRFTNPSLAANDGKRRYLKALHEREGATASEYTAEVSVLPWTVTIPGDPGTTEPPPPAAALGPRCIDVSLIDTIGHGTVFTEVPSASTPLDDAGHKWFDARGFRRVRLQGVVVGALPAGAYLFGEFSTDGATWLPMNPVAGPVLPIDDAGAVPIRGDWVELDPAARTDIIVRGSTVGGNGTDDLIVGELSAQFEPEGVQDDAPGGEVEPSAPGATACGDPIPVLGALVDHVSDCGLELGGGGAGTVVSDDLEYDTIGALDAVWTKTDTSTSATESVTTSDTDGAESVIRISHTGSPNGLLYWERTFDAGDGIAPSTSYTVRLKGKRNPSTGLDTGVRLEVEGVITLTHAFQTGSWEMAELTVTSTPGAELTVRFGFFGGFPFPQVYEARFSAFEIEGLTAVGVVTWPDQSGNGNDLTWGSGTKPTATGAALNGRTTLKFDNAYLAWPTDLLDDVTQLEAFVLLKSTAGSGLWRLGANAAADTLFPDSVSGNLLDNFGSSERQDAGDPVVDPTAGFVLYNPRTGPTGWAAFLDALTQAEPAPHTFAASPAPVFGRSGASTPGDFEVARLTIFPRILTEAERSAWVEMLKTEYDLDLASGLNEGNSDGGGSSGGPGTPPAPVTQLPAGSRRLGLFNYRYQTFGSYPPFNSSVHVTAPSDILDILDAAETAGIKIWLAPIARDQSQISATDKRYSHAKALAYLQGYAGIDISPYADTIIGLYVNDEFYCADCWGGTVIPASQVDDLARAHKAMFPGFRTYVRAAASRMQSYAWRYVDGCWNQWEGANRNGSEQAATVQEYIARHKAIAQAKGLRCVWGLNLLNGGYEGPAGTYSTRKRMSAAEIRRDGTALAQESYSDGLVVWAAGPPPHTYALQTSGDGGNINAALTDVAAILALT